MTDLYVAGFVSSLVVGTTIGALADVLGRKKMAIREVRRTMVLTRVERLSRPRL